MTSKLKEIGYVTILMIFLTGLTTLICYSVQAWGWTDKPWQAGPIVSGLAWIVLILCVLFQGKDYSSGGHSCTGNYNCICGGGGCD